MDDSGAKDYFKGQAQEVSFAMDASRKSRAAFAAANPRKGEALCKEGMLSVRKALDFNFQDVDGFLRHLSRSSLHSGASGHRLRRRVPVPVQALAASIAVSNVPSQTLHPRRFGSRISAAYFPHGRCRTPLYRLFSSSSACTGGFTVIELLNSIHSILFTTGDKSIFNEGFLSLHDGACVVGGVRSIIWGCDSKLENLLSLIDEEQELENEDCCELEQMGEARKMDGWAEFASVEDEGDYG
nr:uncharacterized protein LOC109182758 [Ipomoea trifida]